MTFSELRTGLILYKATQASKGPDHELRPETFSGLMEKLNAAEQFVNDLEAIIK